MLHYDNLTTDKKLDGVVVTGKFRTTVMYIWSVNGEVVYELINYPV